MKFCQIDRYLFDNSAIPILGYVVAQVEVGLPFLFCIPSQLILASQPSVQYYQPAVPRPSPDPLTDCRTNFKIIIIKLLEPSLGRMSWCADNNYGPRILQNGCVSFLVQVQIKFSNYYENILEYVKGMHPIPPVMLDLVGSV